MLTFAPGSHTIVIGDCAKVMHEHMERESVDVVVTSPPYNLGINYSKYDDHKKTAEYLEWFRWVSCGVWNVLKNEGSYFLNFSGAPREPALPYQVLCALLEDHWVLQNPIAWVKSITVPTGSFGHFKPVNSKRYINQTWEHVWHLTKTGDVPVDKLAIGVPFADKTNVKRFGAEGRADLRDRGNSWFIPYETIQSKEEKGYHPAIFPVALPEMCIRLHGVKNPVVLDPFVGTGTTNVATRRVDGTSIGIEIDPTYARDVAMKKIGGDVQLVDTTI